MFINFFGANRCRQMADSISASCLSLSHTGDEMVVSDAASTLMARERLGRHQSLMVRS